MGDIEDLVDFQKGLTERQDDRRKRAAGPDRLRWRCGDCLLNFPEIKKRALQSMDSEG